MSKNLKVGDVVITVPKEHFIHMLTKNSNGVYSFPNGGTIPTWSLDNWDTVFAGIVKTIVAVDVNFVWPYLTQNMRGHTHWENEHTIRLATEVEKLLYA